MKQTVINPLTLPSLPLANRSALPSCAAIYFVLEGDHILYIGRTTNLQQRWMAHHRYSQLTSETRIAWLESSDPELLPEIEAALIAHFNPPLNGTAVIGGKIIFNLSLELKAKLEQLASLERRSVSKMALLLVEEGLQRAEELGRVKNGQ